MSANAWVLLGRGMEGQGPILVAALCAGLAAAFMQPIGRRLPLQLRLVAASTRRTESAQWVLVALVIALGVLVPGEHMAFGLATAVIAAASIRLYRRRRQRSRAREESERVLEACGILSSELVAGRAPEAALVEAALAWPGLTPVVRSAQMGADVPAALRAAAQMPGAGDAKLIAAAWALAHRSGEGLGAALHRTAAGLRAARATSRVVESELASARATARLLAVLPVAALVVGSGSGGDPWHFLGATPAGLLCLAMGLVLEFTGLWWIETIADGVERQC